MSKSGQTIPAKMKEKHDAIWARTFLTSKVMSMTTNQKPDLPPTAPIQTGRYRHYKGNE